MLCIIVLYKFANRKRITEIMIYGLLVSLIGLTLDTIGTGYVLWEYPIRLFPVSFSEVHDLVLFPVVFMLNYQRYTQWKSFIISTVLLSFLLSFVGENTAIWLNFYREISWKHIYSFPVYIAIAIICKIVTSQIIHKD